MRKSLRELMTNSLIVQFSNVNNHFAKTSLTSLRDCYVQGTDSNITEIIYNSIVDYCLNEDEIDLHRLDENQSFALNNRLRYSAEQELDVQLKYGFFGEVLLNSLLISAFCTDRIIAKGYFYSPIEKSESKGYDAFHFVEDNGKISFWFGEAKMYVSVKNAVKSVLENINKSLSKQYYSDNARAIILRGKDLNTTSCTPVFTELLKKLRNEELRDIYKEISSQNIETVYPILLCFTSNKQDFSEKIQEAISVIEVELLKVTVSNEIKAEILFVLVPLNSVIDVKKEVLEWISTKKPLI